MRARIFQPYKNGLHYGQVYNEKHKCWEDVTPLCFKEWGAKRELKKWKKKNYPKEFEI